MGTILIVGASRGLGRGLVDEHLRRGWDVIGTGRQPSEQRPWAKRLELELLDTTDWAAIDSLADRLPQAIERLFVVAGVGGPNEPIGRVDPDGFTETMLANTLGPLRVVDRFADHVTETGTIAVMSSSQGSVALNDSATNETYRISKAGLNMGLRSVVARRGDGRTYLAVNPGWVRTAIGTDHAELSVEESVPRVVDVLDSREGRGGVAFVDFENETVPW